MNVKKRSDHFMKFKKFILTAVAAILGVISCVFVTACKPAQGIYTESTQKINNPDQGFYRPIYVKVTDDGVTYNKNIVTASTQLYHLRTDISVFSGAVNGNADKPLSQAALDGLDELLSYLKSKDKNAIVRFAYAPNFGDMKDAEPAQEVILQHIGQVSPILNRYESTITAIEAGLIGPWGEMHSSQIANAEHISPIIETFLSNTSDIPVLVRTPKMIYNYLGITVDEAETYSIDASNKAYRLGLFNDGYLGSNNDLGTYTNREKDIAFLGKQNEHLPYGGEVVVPDSPLHDIEACLPEMNQIHLSYLNVEWNNQVIDKWKNGTYTKACGNDKIYYGKTAFEYIENHMGYRFVLTNSALSYTKKLNRLSVTLTLKNVGFGNLNRTKNAKLLLVNENGETVYSTSVGNFSECAKYTCDADLNAELSGKYDVYLCLYGDEYEGTPLYSLQFANDGLWNEALKANKIGSIQL